jgi:hypothetical protein
MSHLTFETIARLVDEPPSTEDAAHLEACTACRAELEDMRADAEALAALPPIEPPDGEWRAVERRLTREGLIRRAVTGGTTGAVLIRMAAALVLFMLGTAAGIAWMDGRQPADSATRDQMAAAPSSGTATEPPAETAVQPAPPQRTAAESAAPYSPAVASLPAALASNPQLAAFLDGEEPRSYEAAMQLYRETEMLYLDALTRVAQMNGGIDAGDPIARLAALEAITSITRTALGQAPADPVLNGYHVTALAQRDATLRQIADRAGDSWF